VKELADRGGAFAEEVLFDALSTAKAWEMLNDPKIVGPLNTEEYFDLCIDAGYSKESAGQAAKLWAQKRLAKDVPM
jgi:hypothetical protein